MGNSISYEVCTGCGVDGVDVIRISITSEDGTITSLDVPIGSWFILMSIFCYTRTNRSHVRLCKYN